MIFGAIVAGGIGSRLNTKGVPKQFLPIGKQNKPIIIHTLEKFILCSEFDHIYLGVHKEWIEYTESLLEKYISDTDRITIVKGGAERNLTILNILSKIEEDYGKSNDHIAVTHDAVRPFVTLRMIKENITAALEYGACDTVVEAVDTIIKSIDGDFLDSVPKRSEMYLGQTPQSFNIKSFKEIYSDLSQEEKDVLTDACKVFAFRNKKVKLVRGDASNIKITTPSDYKIANAILGGNICD